MSGTQAETSDRDGAGSLLPGVPGADHVSGTQAEEADRHGEGLLPDAEGADAGQDDANDPQVRSDRMLLDGHPVVPAGTRPLLTRPRVRALLTEHDLVPTRALGQNYLVDPNTSRKVARLGGARPGLPVLEIGPGLGSLTLALREAGAAVTAVEVDGRLVPALRRVIGDDQHVRVHVADALRADLAALAPGVRTLISNLPYAVATPIIMRVLSTFPQFDELTVMIQREVGERLAAAPGTDAYGAVSAKVAALADARVAASVSRHVFMPEPRVDSVLVRLTRRPHPALLDEAAPGTSSGPVLPELYPRYAQVVEAAFAQRRKTLRNTLRRLVPDVALVEHVCTGASIDPGVRAERLGVPEFAALTRGLTPYLP